MSAYETSIGGPGRSFPSTRWSSILSAADPDNEENRERLDWLLRAYWKPVYAYVRAAWGKSVEDAKDLTQAFLAEMLRRNLLARFQPDRGSFRSYLKGALRNFLIDAERADAARRPARPLLSLDAVPGELERIVPEAGESPDQLYDREWFGCVVEASIESLRELLTRQGKAVYFEVFRMYCLGPTAAGVTDDGGSKTPTYREVAAGLGIRETDVDNHLATARESLRHILRERIRDYVAADEEVEAELREILRS